jgi:SAM-dependent methyltransferase
LFDIPSGQGALAKELVQMGFKVIGGDINKDNFLLKFLMPFVQVDMNYYLPFRDKTFDYVACVEGLEHLENPFHVIREFSRILRKKGKLVITIPNIMNIKSRFRFLIYSYFDFFRYYGNVPEDERHKIEEYGHFHLNPINYSEISFILRNNGFRIISISTNRYVKRWKLLHDILKPIIVKKTREKFPMDKTLLSREILEGEILLIYGQNVSK